MTTTFFVLSHVGEGRIAKRVVPPMFDRLIDAVLIFGFPLGILVGYMWRARISRARRDRYLHERSRAPHVMQKSAPTLAPRCAIDSDLGVDHQTADVIRAKLEDGGEIPHQAEVIAKDRVSQPRKKRAKAARKPRASKDPAPTLAPRCAIDSDLGVDHQTADVIRAKLEDGSEIPHQAEVIAKDGVSQPRKKRAKAARKPRTSKAAPL